MKEYSADLDRLEAKCSELLHRRTTRIITKQIRKERAMERREKALELAGMVSVAAATCAVMIACFALF